jgi:endonuclease G
MEENMPRTKTASKRPTTKRKLPANTEQYDRMKRFIRTRADEFLKDPNISSVGIGYKQKAGKDTGTLSLQFCVDQKVSPQALESVSSKSIPAQVEFEGMQLPTDVVQRAFKPGYLLMEPEVIKKDPRKQRADTLTPGISIANARTTAGTLGTFVLDQRTGERVILSNWHVLHTATGAVGDTIVQPGPFDDNRTDQNAIGKLLRSHLGVAGDCAICSVESRNTNPEILGLKAEVRRVAKAELGDRVTKSGRTTGVTFGVVTRVETVTRMNYDGRTEQIGGFEIGVDPKRKPKDGEISKGGDSGAVWLATDNKGKATGIMLGLHFAGDADDSDAEFALACNAHSVFEKLEIAALSEGGAVPATISEASRPELQTGFDLGFLSFPVPQVKFTSTVNTDLATLSGSPAIRYCHFSAWLSKSRRFPRVVAWNIDGGNIKKLDRDGIPFVKDERGNLEQFQIGDELYAGNPLDRGHVARRADLCWGSAAEANQANRDSFFFTNITPQHQRFNQGLRHGLWGRLEDALFEDVKVAGLRISLLGGPILRKNDPLFEGVRIPTEFWKLLAYTDDADDTHKVRAYILTQRNLVRDMIDAQSLELNEFQVYQVPLSRIEQDSGIRFTSAFKALDAMPAAPQGLGPNVRLVTSQEDLFK